eukprot:COSAG05_NODE_13025_length_444_cov_1.344928_1_plen_60_part_10
MDYGDATDGGGEHEIAAAAAEAEAAEWAQAWNEQLDTAARKALGLGGNGCDVALEFLADS